MRDEHVRILSKGNTLLHHWSKKLLGPNKVRKFRALLLANRLNGQIPLADLEAIRAVYGIQNEVVAEHIRIVYNLVNRRSHGSVDWESELESVGMFALQDAIFNFIPDEGKRASFATYAYHTIRRRLNRKMQQLIRASSMITHFTDMGTEEDFGEMVVDNHEDRHSGINIEELISKASLNPLESAAISIDLNADYGSKGESMGLMINEKTGKRYSRMAFAKARKRAQQKLAKVLQ